MGSRVQTTDTEPPHRLLSILNGIQTVGTINIVAVSDAIAVNKLGYYYGWEYSA